MPTQDKRGSHDDIVNLIHRILSKDVSELLRNFFKDGYVVTAVLEIADDRTELYASGTMTCPVLGCHIDGSFKGVAEGVFQDDEKIRYLDLHRAMLKALYDHFDAAHSGVEWKSTRDLLSKREEYIRKLIENRKNHLQKLIEKREEEPIKEELSEGRNSSEEAIQIPERLKRR